MNKKIYILLIMVLVLVTGCTTEPQTNEMDCEDLEIHFLLFGMATDEAIIINDEQFDMLDDDNDDTDILIELKYQLNVTNQFIDYTIYYYNQSIIKKCDIENDYDIDYYNEAKESYINSMNMITQYLEQ